MTTSPHLSGKLREALGTEAGDELIGIVDKAASDISDLRGDVAELRHEMQTGFARIEQSIAAIRLEVKSELTTQLAAVQLDLTGKIADVKSDLMKWSFVFWVGAVGAIAMLAGVLRN